MSEKFPLLLAKNYEDYEESIDPTGWLMSEKLDGVRAYWKNGQLWSRISNPFAAPDWWTCDLPDIELDGEIFWKRGAFNETSGRARRKDPASAELWRDLTYQVFDAPGLPNLVFEERIAWLESVGVFGCQYARVVPHERVRSREHLQARLDEVVAAGGEGLMLRAPGSMYEFKRSKTLLKVKPWYSDEVRVVGVEPWRGVLRPGRETWMGALSCVMRDGTEVRVGSGFDDSQRLPPHEHWIGEIITINFRDKSEYGVPRHPVFAGVAIDKEFP